MCSRPGAAAGALALAGLLAAQQPAAPADRDARMAWWREARFGLFVHWGLYAIPAGRWNGKPYPAPSEWLMHHAQIRAADYEPLLARWNPTAFDADAWARLARDAGMRYVVITSKHHDGFALWDSAVSDWDVGSAPLRTDVLGELARACRRHGLRFGLYHSILDWHHPDYVPRRAWDPRPESKPDFERYVAYLKAQLRELIERYDPDILWFDGEWEESWTHERGQDLARFVRGLKPEILLNNRIDKGRSGMAGLDRDGAWAGDFGTPEQEIPPRGFPGVDWETCMTINASWGFHQDDATWKDSVTLIRNLADVAAKGGNYLLNVGPTAAGEIPPESVERLVAIGAWVRAHEAAIRGTGRTPFERFEHPCTTRPGRLYVHLFGGHGTSLELPGLRNAIERAWLHADPERTPLAVTAGPRGPIVTLPAALAPGQVVEIAIDGDAKAEPVPLRPDAEGRITLHARDAGILGRHARYEADKRCVGFWTEAGDRLLWTFHLDAAARFRVRIELACAGDSAGSEYELRAGDARLRGTVAATGGWSRFTTVELGQLELAAGPHELAVVPIRKPGLAVMNLRSVVLLRD